MNKADLINKVYSTTTLNKTQAAMAIDAITSAICDALKSGDRITLNGFGSFSSTKRNARMGRNPKNGERVAIPPRTLVKFKAGKELSETLR